MIYQLSSLYWVSYGSLYFLRDWSSSSKMSNLGVELFRILPYYPLMSAESAVIVCILLLILAICVTCPPPQQFMSSLFPSLEILLRVMNFIDLYRELDFYFIIFSVAFLFFVSLIFAFIFIYLFPSMRFGFICFF